MKIWLLCCVLSCMCKLSTFAQPDSTRTWQMRWALTSLVDPRTPTFQMGLQKNITSKWALSFDYGLSTYGLLNKKYYTDSVRTNFRYQKMRTELKYLFPVFKSAVEGLQYAFYLSLEGVFIPERYNKHNNYLEQNDRWADYYFSRVKRNIWVTSLKGGCEWRIERKWVLDTFVGLGSRRIHIQHYETVFGGNFSPEPRPYILPLNFPGRDQKEGWYSTIHVAGGLKLGYYIW